MQSDNRLIRIGTGDRERGQDAHFPRIARREVADGDNAMQINRNQMAGMLQTIALAEVAIHLIRAWITITQRGEHPTAPHEKHIPQRPQDRHKQQAKPYKKERMIAPATSSGRTLAGARPDSRPTTHLRRIHLILILLFL